jgi:hypothetical protein
MAEGYNPNSASAEHRRKLDQSHAASLKAKATAPDATERDKQRYQSYLDKKEQMANDYNDRMEREDIEQEALYRRRGSSSAYDRDYQSSISGMGKRQSRAYQADGGANDEGEQDDPTPQRRAAPKGMYFYNVPTDKEDKAREVGLFQTKSGKWYSPFENTRANMFFGRGRYWEPKTEATGDAVGTISSATPDGKVKIKTATGNEIETDKDALIPGASGTLQMKPDAAGDALKPGAKVVSTETSVITELDPPPNDSTSPIHGGRSNSDHGEHNEIISLLRRMLSRR